MGLLTNATKSPKPQMVAVGIGSNEFPALPPIWGVGLFRRVTGAEIPVDGTNAFAAPS